MLFEISASAKVPVIKGESTEYSAKALFKADIEKLKQMNENGSSVLADNIQKQMSSLNQCEIFMEFGDEADEVSFVENTLNVTYDVELIAPNEGKASVAISPTPLPTTFSPSPQPTLLQPPTISVASVAIALLVVTTLLGENDVALFDDNVVLCFILNSSLRNPLIILSLSHTHFSRLHFSAKSQRIQN